MPGMFKATYQAITKGKIPCGINYLFLHALCMPGIPIQHAYMSHRISKA